MPKRYPARFIVFAVSLIIFLGIDRLTKSWAVHYLRHKGPIVILSGVLEFRYTENTGAAFGLMQGMRPFFIVLGICAVIYCFLLFMRIPAERIYIPLGIALILIASGAAGNLLDRIQSSYVVDFIYFRLIDFPVFNFADILVTLSAVLIIVLFILIYNDEDISRIPFRIFR